MSATRPAHHFPGQQFNPAVPGIPDAKYPGATEPGTDGKIEVDRMAGQPDHLPQRPDIVVEKTDEEGLSPTILS